MGVAVLKIAARSCAIAAAVVLFTQVTAAQAQSTNPGQDAANLPRIELTDAQKQTIFTSVTNQNFKNSAPPDFQPIVGAVVPSSIPLEDMPKTIVELAPRTDGFQLARVVNQVVIVDPKSRRVVEVIAGEKP